jgi:hypothetical protein
MNRDTARQIAVIVALVLMIAINVLANVLPLNGLDTGEISDRFDIFFVPAGYVFSIWGIIYIALAAYAVYQAVPARRENPRLRAIGYLFVLSSLANVVWLFLWHYEVFNFTLVAMLALLVLLILIYLRLDIGRAEVPSGERWLVHVPFSIYLGWITVATIANVTQLLFYLNWGGWGIAPEVWAVIMLVVATGVAAAMAFVRGDVAYNLVLVWAFVGIAIEHATTSLVTTAAWVAAAAVAVLLVVGGVLARRRR